jgi:hypothetical protein
MRISQLSLSNINRNKTGNQGTAGLAEPVNGEVKSEFNNKTDLLMEKDDKIELIERINDTRVELIERINDTRVELANRISSVEAGLTNRISGVEAGLTNRISGVEVGLTNRINDTKVELIDRINKSKNETIIWIVGIGVLQFILSILSKKFL